MKTNYRARTVSGNVSFSFDDMECLTDIFETAALEAATNDANPARALHISRLADNLGFEIDPDLLPAGDNGDQDFTPAQAGQDSALTG